MSLPLSRPVAHPRGCSKLPQPIHGENSHTSFFIFSPPHTFLDFFPLPFLLEFFCGDSRVSSSLSAALGGAVSRTGQEHGGNPNTIGNNPPITRGAL